MNESIGGVHHDEILDLIRNQVTEGTPVWIAGSLVEGIGNDSSDIDVYMVVEDLNTIKEFVTDGCRFKIQIHYFKSRRVDVEIWSYESIDRLASKIDSLQVDNAENSFLDALDENEIDFAHRIFNCRVVRNTDAYADIVDRFDRVKINRYLFENKRIYIDDSFDDTVGMLNSGNISGAIRRSQETLEFSIDLLLYSKGWTNPKNKHRFKILEAIYESDIDAREVYLDYWSFMHNLPINKYDKRDYVNTALHLSEKMVEKAYCLRREAV
ncbi:MAG: hypothetical protein P8X74_09945 [Reinekea sp.]|jgi:hypothetical protein